MVHVLSLFAVLSVGLLLRCYNLNGESIWLDETTSIYIAQQTLSDIINGVGFDQHTPPAYYIILHYWSALFGTSAVALRAFSLVCDMLNAVLLWQIARMLFTPRAALFAVACYSLSPFAVYYAQEGRMYTLLLLEVLLSTYLVLRMRKSGLRALEGVALAIVGVVGMYTHYYYPLFFASICLAVLISHGLRSREFWQIAAIGFLIALSFIPWIRVILGLIGSGGQTFREFTHLMLPYTFLRYVVGYGIMPLAYGTKDDPLATLIAHIPTLAPPLLLFAGIIAFGVIRLCTIEGRQASYLLAPLIVPAVIAMLISLKVPMLSERYLIISYPFFLLTLTYGLLQSRSSDLGLALCLLVFFYGTVQQIQNPLFGNTNWRAAAEYMHSQELLDSTPPPVLVTPKFADDCVRLNSAQTVEIVEIEDKSDEQLLSRHAYIWLVERADLDSQAPKLKALGFSQIREQFFPKGHGLRVGLWENADRARN